MAVITDEVRQKIEENNARIISDMKMGKPLGSVDMWQVWYPPREIFKKHEDALDFGLPMKKRPSLQLVTD